jgi:hypothetical protein
VSQRRQLKRLAPKDTILHVPSLKVEATSPTVNPQPREALLPPQAEASSHSASQGSDLHYGTQVLKDNRGELKIKTL